jgi:hypothetical protein
MKGEGGGGFFFPFTFCYSFIIWKFFVIFCLLLKGEGGHDYFFLVNYFTFEKGRGAWVYLLIIIFLKIYYLYSFVTFFTS